MPGTHDHSIRYVLSLPAVLAVSTPALAAEYFVVRGPDKKCKVVETRPTDKTVVVVDDRAYVTREEAEKQGKVVCKDLLPSTQSTGASLLRLVVGP